MSSRLRTVRVKLPYVLVFRALGLGIFSVSCATTPEYLAIDNTDRYYEERLEQQREQLQLLQKSYNRLVTIPDPKFGECYAPEISRNHAIENWIRVACTLDAPTTRVMQTKLRELRYYDGASDGFIGPNTLTAVKSYASDRGLPSVANAIQIAVLQELEIDIGGSLDTYPSVLDEDALHQRIQSIVTNTLSRYAERRNFYFRDEIPPKKLDNAAVAVGIPDDEDVLALLDMTLLGSANKAVVFATRGMYANGESGQGFLSYVDFSSTKVILDGKYYVFLSNGIKLNFAPLAWQPDDFEELFSELTSNIDNAY